MEETRSFQYKARDIQGKVIKKTVTHSSEEALISNLNQKGLFLIECKEVKAGLLSSKIKNIFLTFFNKTPLNEVLFFTKQLLVVYQVGIPILKGLEMIVDQIKDKHFKERLGQIQKAIQDGNGLSESMRKCPETFDDTYTALIEAGENSGKLDLVLSKNCSFLERKIENKRQIKSATFYPKIVIGVMLLVFVVIVYFVIPKISTFYDKFDGDLPFITQSLITVSDFCVNYWYICLLSVIGLSVAFFLTVSNKKGLKLYHQFLLKIPIFGDIFKYLEWTYFCAILKLLLESGVPVIRSLELTKSSMSNVLFKEELSMIQESVNKGEMINTQLKKSKLWPDMMGGLIEIGEETGNLGNILDSLGNYYSDQLRYKLANLSKTLEPILLFVIFGGVMFLALGIFMPMWKLTSIIKK